MGANGLIVAPSPGFILESQAEFILGLHAEFLKILLYEPHLNNFS